MSRSDREPKPGDRVTAFLIVAPRLERFENAAYLLRIKAALNASLPCYEFTVTTDHAQRHASAFFVEADAPVENLSAIEKIADTLAPYIEDRSIDLQ